jgi:nucleotide sugar dehydrogenase
MNVTVIGMGKIGLPLAVNFARHGANVTGLDLQDGVVSQINLGVPPFPGEEELDQHLLDCVANSKLNATTDQAESISSADTIVVCIPLIVDSNGKPDFQNIDQLVIELGKNIAKGVLICFETTLPVGTTRERFTPAIEATSGLKAGQDFFVVFSPERVLTGRVFKDLKRYPKLVGGVTRECSHRGIEFYRKMIDFDLRVDLPKANGVWEMRNSDAAEFAKIAETTFRDVNIGLANEFALYAADRDIDILEVIEASNSQPFSNIHIPGISVGGHCIPIYPLFFTWNNPNSQIVTTARSRNLAMPARAVEQIKKEMGHLKGLKIGILGVSYRAGVKETAFSGALTLLNLLKNEGCLVYATDPFFNEVEIASLGFEGVVDFTKLDGIIVHTNHDEFSNLQIGKFQNLKFFYDGRRSFPDLKSNHDFIYITY